MARRARKPITEQLRTIRTSIRRIDRALRRLAPLLRDAEKAARVSRRAPRRRLDLSPQRRALLRLQGRYMGYVRQLGPKQKSQVKKVREARGYRAAIAAAMSLARR